MASVTLDDIRRAADAKYGPFVITDLDVTLLNPLRMSRDKRDALVAKQADLNAAGASSTDGEALLRELFDIVAATPADVDRLYAATAGDVTLLIEVLTQYGQGAQTGEASPSAS